MKPVGASNNPDKFKHHNSVKRYLSSPTAVFTTDRARSQIISSTSKPKLKEFFINADKCNIFSKGYTFNWNGE